MGLEACQSVSLKAARRVFLQIADSFPTRIVDRQRCRWGRVHQNNVEVSIPFAGPASQSYRPAASPKFDRFARFGCRMPRLLRTESERIDEQAMEDEPTGPEGGEKQNSLTYY